MSRHSPMVWLQSPKLVRQNQHKSLYYSLRRYTQLQTDPHYPRFNSPPPPSPSQYSSPISPRPRPDPFTLLSSELSFVRTSILTLLHSGNPALTEMAEYYFLPPSKQIRPLIILLFSQATNGLGSRWPEALWHSTKDGARGTWEELDRPLARPDVLNDWNPKSEQWTREFKQEFEIETTWEEGRRPSPPPIYPHLPKLHTPPLILPAQFRLAQITEILHNASLLHDDVVDESPLRRGVPSGPAAFGNKLSILAGTFIIGRATAALARLREREGTELASSVIMNIVDGEILQLKNVNDEEKKDKVGGNTREEVWNRYLQKTYFKAASMMAKGARGAVMAGGCEEGDIIREIAYAYGRNLGMAFQFVDDVLDYEAASEALGKPGGADLRSGLATAPTLYAWEEHPEMGELIQRNFSKEGDVERARDYIERSSGIQRTRDLAHQCANKAKEVIQSLPDSEAKGALEVLAERVASRKS